MSVQATNWAIQHSQHKGSELLCLIMIADCCDSEGKNAWPSIDRLAERCRMSRRQIIRIIHALEVSGEVIVERGTGPNGTHYFRLPMQIPLCGCQIGSRDKLSPVTNPTKGGDKLAQRGVTPMSPKSSIDHSSSLKRKGEPGV